MDTIPKTRIEDQFLDCISETFILQDACSNTWFEWFLFYWFLFCLFSFHFYFFIFIFWETAVLFLVFGQYQPAPRFNLIFSCFLLRVRYFCFFSCVIIILVGNCLFLLYSSSCVFRPAIGCSARRSLVKINFLTLKQLFGYF